MPYADCVSDRADSVQPLGASDADAAATFLHDNLNPAVSASAWRALLDPPWASPDEDRGRLLVHDGAIVGVAAVVRSHREWDGERVAIANLGALCVLEEHRARSLALVRAVLRPRDGDFTDLSPSGNVVAMNERLGFRRLDTAARLVVNVPRSRQRGVTIVTEPDAIARLLMGEDARILRDHREAPAALHVAAQTPDGTAYLMFRRDRRKGLPLFASPLYAGGDPGALEAAWPSVAAHLVSALRLPATIAERRVLGFDPRGPGRELAHPRPKMWRGPHLTADRVDYLYSELTLVSW